MVRTTRFLLFVLIPIVAFGVNPTNAQTVSFKNFTSFPDIVPDTVDFFASNRETIAPYEDAAKTSIEKVKQLLGDDIPKGAIFICTNQAQLDSLYEPVVIRQGYSWVLILTTPDVRMRTQLEEIKARIGDNIPAEFLERINAQLRDAASNVDPQAVSNMARNIAFAILQVSTSDEYFQFRASRVEDVGKSILQDWLDIGVGSYVNGDKSSVKYLQDNIDMMFPIDDVIFMSRPFVASSTTSGNQGGSGGGREMAQIFQQMDSQEMAQIFQQMGGGQMAKMRPGGGEGGGFPGGDGGGPGGQRPGGGPGGGPGGQRPGGGPGGAPKSKPERAGQQRALSKDEQDRLLFDGQAISFFDFFLEKFGIEKVRELIKFSSEGNESWDFVSRTDLFGRDFSKVEADWMEWLMKQKVSDPKPKSKVQQ